MSSSHRFGRVRRAQARPGAQLLATCSPAVAAAAESAAAQLAQQIGARFRIETDPAAPRERIEVSAR